MTLRLEGSPILLAASYPKRYSGTRRSLGATGLVKFFSPSLGRRHKGRQKKGTHERIAGGDDLVNPPPRFQRRFPRLNPPPPPQLNLGGEDDLYGIGLTAGDTQHPMGLNRSR